MERLAHGAERLLEPRGLGARDPERPAELLGGETQQLPRRHHRAEVTEDRGDVPPAIGEHRADDPADPRLDLEARDERLESGGERLGRAADGGADPVGEGKARGRDHGVGQRSELEPEDEVDQRVRDGRACVLAHHGTITCSVVMMNGASPGAMKLGSSARTRGYGALAADARMAWVSSNHVIATPS